MRTKALFLLGSLALASAVSRDAPAEVRSKVPVTVKIVGHGTIRLMVADGTSGPCDSSENHVLYDKHATAGDEIKLASATGSLCVDHTYGAFRESQWSGPSIWSGSGTGFANQHPLSGSISTDEP